METTGHLDSRYAVIFTSKRTEGDNGYGVIAERMEELASRQPGFISVESVRDSSGAGITVSYWDSLEAIREWKRNEEHLTAQRTGREQWYSSYQVKICKVEKEYDFHSSEL
ncbi:antibiotic biosynthesis monooxygenase family protein [Paenibacillus gorillae]|uniref:antibiotic biosynthesis monooxygenase family protein n=1 Tax=Paenibacillus gorillae TaxID=1243662 RepID=UPI0004B9FA21|nr:antibiotic biosynthesis monooxygenase [Paenibacillus gorillae]